MSAANVEAEYETGNDRGIDIALNADDEDVQEARNKVGAGEPMLFPDRSTFTPRDSEMGGTVLFVINNLTDGEFYTSTDTFDRVTTEVSFGVRNGRTLLEIIHGAGPDNVLLHEVCIGRGEELIRIGEPFTADFGTIVTVSNIMKTQMLPNSPTYQFLKETLDVLPGN